MNILVFVGALVSVLHRFLLQLCRFYPLKVLYFLKIYPVKYPEFLFYGASRPGFVMAAVPKRCSLIGQLIWSQLTRTIPINNSHTTKAHVVKFSGAMT